MSAPPWLLIGRADPRVQRERGEDFRQPFSYYNKQVEIHDSARRHGVADHDILHAIDRWLIIGPDTAANLIEMVVMITDEGNQIAIHAMPMRDKYARLLEP